MRSCFVTPVLAAACLAAVALGQTPPPARQLILLGGEAVPFGSIQIDAGKITSQGVPAGLTLDDLARIELAPVEPSAAKSPIIAELRGGGRIATASATIGDDQCRLALGDETLALPVDLVRAIRFDASAASPDFDKAVAAPSAEMDRVFVKDEAGKLTSVSGLIETLAAEQLTLQIDGQKRSIPRASLVGIIVAQPDAKDAPARCLITFQDGSTLGGQSLGVMGEEATLELPAGGKLKIPWSLVARVAIRSSRVLFLSDLKPVSEEQQAIVTFPRPWQRDKSVSGGPLAVGGRTFEKGIGVHARSLLTFAAERNWDTLAATIGLDAAAGGKGDCVFTVLADGQPVFTRRMTGMEGPQELEIPIAGREQVTLLVEPGAGLDLGDHANWCDVRFLKNRK